MQYNYYLETLKFQSFTAIQLQSFEAFSKNRSIVGIAPTGTGKTLAYGIPVIHDIKQTLKLPQAIILVPTQELVTQVRDMLSVLRPNLDIKALTFRDQDFDKDIMSHVIVSTPRKFGEALLKDHRVNTKHVKHLIFDEADMMFGEEFITEIKPIADHMQTARFYLYSASLKPSMKPFIKHYFGAYLLVDTSKIDKPNITHYAIEVLETTRYESLKLLLETVKPYLGIVFVSKKETLQLLEKKLNDDHIKCDVISSANGARERAQLIKKIQRLDTTWVISSDVLARGLDMDFSHVIHYDLPRPLSLFSHRSGRTGRMKQTGDVITLYSTQDHHDIEKLKASGVSFKKAILKPEGMVVKTKQSRKPSEFKKKHVVKPNYKKKLKQERMKKA